DGLVQPSVSLLLLPFPTKFFHQLFQNLIKSLPALLFFRGVCLRPQNRNNLTDFFQLQSLFLQFTDAQKHADISCRIPSAPPGVSSYVQPKLFLPVSERGGLLTGQF